MAVFVTELDGGKAERVTVKARTASAARHAKLRHHGCDNHCVNCNLAGVAGKAGTMHSDMKKRVIAIGGLLLPDEGWTFCEDHGVIVGTCEGAPGVLQVQHVV